MVCGVAIASCSCLCWCLQCNINLQKDVLHLGGCDVDLPFLAEHELPESMRREGKALDGQDPSVPSASGQPAHFQIY